MVVLAVVVILQEEVLVCAVSSESDRCDTQAREKALKSVPPSERTRVTPCLAGRCQQIGLNASLKVRGDQTYLRAQGSRLAYTEDGEAAALNCLISNPVGCRADIVAEVTM